MKIAFPSLDGETISTHFGSAPIFTVVTIKNQVVVSQENRQKPVVSVSNQQGQKHDHHKFDLLNDCQAVIAGGMGENAFHRLKEMGIEVFLVKEKNIQNAITSYLAGELIHQQNRIHKHHSN